jgi:hypothetical protein
MLKKGLMKKFWRWEVHNKVFFFIIVMILTILITRGLVLINNPEQNLLGFELHHFDYGMVLLFITTLLLLFGRKNLKIHLILAGISFGLILDDIWFIRGNLSDPSGTTETLIYNATLPSAILLVIIIIMAIFLIKYLKEHYSRLI